MAEKPMCRNCAHGEPSVIGPPNRFWCMEPYRVSIFNATERLMPEADSCMEHKPREHKE